MFRTHWKMFYFLNTDENPGSAFGFLPNGEEKPLSGLGELLSEEEISDSAFKYRLNEEKNVTVC